MSILFTDTIYRPGRRVPRATYARSAGRRCDEDIPSTDTTAVPTATQIQGPITRARVKQLIYQVLSFI
jgi:hypothetical protein